MRLVTDNASSTLVASVNPTDTVLQLTPSGGLNFPSPGPGEYAIITIEDELARREKVKLVGRVDDTLTVERNVEDPALAFSVGARVELRSTASLLSLFYQKNEGDTVDAGTEITLLLQRYLVTGDAPAVGDLVEGEVAINIPDGKVWVGAVGATESNPLAPVVWSTGANGGVAVTQGAHNFSPGQPISLNGATWQRADAGAPGDAVGTHVVGKVRSASSFTAISNGPVSGVTPADLGLVSIVVGQLYYVDPVTPGQYVDVEPIAPGQFSNPLALGLSASSLYVLPWRATEAGGSGGGGAVDTTVSQAGHGFTEADNTGAPVYFDGSLWNLAQANTVATLGVAVIKSVSDINTFTITQAGQLENISEAVNGAAPLTPGEYYFVDLATPGQITSTDPAETTGYSNPLLLALTPDSALVLPWRPSSGGFNNRTVGTWTNSPGQTIFTFANEGPLDVYLNGVLLVKDADYTSDTSGFTLTTGVALPEDYVVAIAYPVVAITDIYNKADVDASIADLQSQIDTQQAAIDLQPILVQEIDVAGLDFETTPIIIDLEPGALYQLKVNIRSAVGDQGFDIHLGTATEFKTSADHRYSWAGYRGSPAGEQGGTGNDGTEIMGGFLFTIGAASIIDILPPADGQLVHTPVYNEIWGRTTGSGYLHRHFWGQYYNAADAGKILTRVRLTGSGGMAANPPTAGYIQVYKMPRVTP